MSSTFTQGLNLEKLAYNDKIDTWDQVGRANHDIVDKATSQSDTILITGDVTLTQAQMSFAALNFSGTPSAPVTITLPPAVARVIQVSNLTKQDITFHQGTGGDYHLQGGAHDTLRCDGAGAGAKVSGLHLIQKLEQDVTATVGATGDFPSINAAMKHFANFYPVYGDNGITVNLQLQVGYVIEEQIICNGVNFGWIKITSLGGSTDHMIDTAKIKKVIVAEGDKYAVIAAMNGGVAPFIDFHARMTVTLDPLVIGFYAAFGGSILGKDGKLGGTGYIGAYAISNGEIVFENDLNISGTKTGAKAVDGGVITCGGELMSGSCSLIGGTALTGGKITAADMNFSKSARGVGVYSGAIIAASNDINVINCPTYGARAVNGGKIASGGIMNCRNGASDTALDMDVDEGGMICRHAGNGGHNVGVVIGTFNSKGYINK